MSVKLLVPVFSEVGDGMDDLPEPPPAPPGPLLISPVPESCPDPIPNDGVEDVLNPLVGLVKSDFVMLVEAG